MSAAAPAAAVLRTTPLHAFHLAHGAHMVPFAGWEMPLYYRGILDEHLAVRSSAGVFDVSHMGILTVSGASGASLLSRRTTANVSRLEPGQCRYTFLTDARGMIVDDLLITRLDPPGSNAPAFLVVPNAGKADKVTELLLQHRRPDTTIVRHNPTVAILAVQGPNSRTALEAEFGWDLATLKFYHARTFPADPGPPGNAGALGIEFPSDLQRSILVSRTGYTGERGYELFVSASRAPHVATSLEARGVVPVGLGARDTLRMEKGYLLSGQDFDRDHTPLEAGLERFVDFDHPFVGRDALEKQRLDGPKVRLSGLVAEEPNVIPRHGTGVLVRGERVTAVTSGGVAPSLQRGIALAYLPTELAAPGTVVDLEIRGRHVPARVTSLPFLEAPAARR